MTSKEFQDGVNEIDACMQGQPDTYDGTKLVKPGTNFDHKFLDYLFKTLKNVPHETWMKVVQRISQKRCKPRDLTLADFLQEVEAYNERIRWERDRRKVTPAPPLPDLKAVYERILADPLATELSRSLAQEGLAKLTRAMPGSGERQKGGEKYRRMKAKESKVE